MITIIVLILLVLLIVGALPHWGYAAGWGYGPAGILAIILVILLILMLTGHLGSLRI